VVVAVEEERVADVVGVDDEEEDDVLKGRARGGAKGEGEGDKEARDGDPDLAGGGWVVVGEWSGVVGLVKLVGGGWSGGAATKKKNNNK
jgi:hypothetical protein